MRIYQKALLREMSETGLYAFAGLAAIIVVTLVARIVGRAAVGEIETEAVWPFIGFGLLNMSPVLLSLALFMAVFLTLNRYWRDSEMVVWFSSGLSHSGWLRPVLGFALAVTLIIACLTLWLLPWLAEKREDYAQYLASRDQLANLSAGVFIEAEGGRKVYFVESLDTASGRIGNVFVRTEENDGRISLTVARQGQPVQLDNGDTYIALQDGRRYEGTPGALDYRLVEFGRYLLRLDNSAPPPRTLRARQLSTAELLRNPTAENRAELAAWRLGHPISAMILAAFAIPLSFINPRAGRSLNALFAILVYAVYNNLAGLSEGWILRGDLSATASLILIHGGMLVLLASLFWLRNNHLRLRWRQ